MSDTRRADKKITQSSVRNISDMHQFLFMLSNKLLNSFKNLRFYLSPQRLALPHRQ
ncbi:hypothetical protein PCO85_16000 [Prodigiosinella aquatilis]|nr:hypothetical protein [Prodigiosinella sp. LS101]WJV52716.1 hypothetical protein PCO85_16000 [Prodigiosinella sp. LS101]WJV57070.1 hypothetical protein PCO84_15980 [Pectobacteriaceae bacterium C111]